MGDIDLLVVGPGSSKTGGIGRYISEQLRHLENRFSTRLYDTQTRSADGAVAFLLAVLDAVVDWVRFPFRNRPDVVHVHTSHYLSFYLSSMYVLFAAYVWGRPVVVHVHGSSFDEFVEEASRPLAAFQSLVFGASDAVVVLSEYWRDTLSVRVPDRKLVVLPNAVAPDDFDPDFSTEPQHLVFVSNHVARKGVVELTTAIQQLYDRGVDFRTTIAGSGPLSHHAEDLADANEDVDYVGYVSEERKRDLLSRGSVYVLPTHAEGLPISILEAMAGGNAVVSTDVGSVPSVVDETNGVLVSPGDVDSLADALERLLESPNETRKRCEASRARVEADYSWTEVAAELEALYRRLLDREIETDAPPTGLTENT